MAEQLQLTAKTFQGLEEILANELRGIGATNIKILKRAVSYKGTLETVYRSNYELRTAVKILQEIKVFKAKTPDDLYYNVKRIAWEDFFSLKDTFAINSVVYSEHFEHSGYAGLKVKDAIADRFREKKGNRPNVSPKTPDIRIELHISGSICTLSFDTTGEPLFKRGYRTFSGTAPLSEILAAGMVLHTQILEQKTIIDPMCGSASLLTEAAMIHLNIPPAINREFFAFEKLDGFSPQIWAAVRETADAQMKQDSAIEFLGFDIDARTANTARLNVQNIDLDDCITIKKGNFFDLKKRAETGAIICNPPYDMRLRNKNIDDFYNQIGTKLKHEFNGWEAWILSGNFKAMKQIGLRPAQKIQLLNGQVPVKFNKYELYKGSKKVSS